MFFKRGQSITDGWGWPARIPSDQNGFELKHRFWYSLLALASVNKPSPISANPIHGMEVHTCVLAQ
jgi:hypothetical protein